MPEISPPLSEPLDVLVVGSGVAGLSCAVRLATLERARVGILTKGSLTQSTTRFAQGGIAAVLPGDEDSTDSHLADTLAAGAGLCDEAAVRVLVDEGPSRVTELIALGAVFDRLPSGVLERALEGGHSSPRILHAGGTATGAEVERALVQAVEETAASLLEHWFALDLLVEEGRCRGVVALDPAGARAEVRAGAVVLACGGAGQLYSVTTNPDEATGDGIAMALRAGVAVADLEFIQFHPTALHHPAMPRPLISEALRGHGAILRTAEGERFVDELAPRDVVSRAIARELTRSGTDHVYLDCTGIEAFSSRFPTIAVALGTAGLDPAREWLPVAPAAHYLCGGVLTDLDGRTSLPGLLAAGEVACTGVHGANRLASNSLLEGLVFGARASEAVSSGRLERAETGVFAPAAVPLRAFGELAPAPAPVRGALRAGEARRRLQAEMSADAGVVRDAASLDAAAKVVAEIETGFGRPSSVEEAEVSNLCLIGRALLEAAAVRRESRGAHTRADFPERSETYRARLVFGGQQSDG